MTANTKQAGSATTHVQKAAKPMQVPTGIVSLPNPSPPQRAVPSHTAIAEKAYGIWLSLGQLIGRDQENWFEAERQLQKV